MRLVCPYCQKGFNTDGVHEDVKTLIALIQKHDANISNFHVSLKGRIDLMHQAIDGVEENLDRINEAVNCNVLNIQEILREIRRMRE